jgi:hypothetical protein
MNEISGKHPLELCAFLLLSAVAFGQATEQKPKIICDHAAPPRGMHYVCKSQCDCHLEGKLKNDEDGVVPAPVDAKPRDTAEPRVCKYDAPKPGNLLVCDSDCRCRTYIKAKGQRKGTKKARP